MYFILTTKTTLVVCLTESTLHLYAQFIDYIYKFCNVVFHIYADMYICNSIVNNILSVALSTVNALHAITLYILYVHIYMLILSDAPNQTNNCIWPIECSLYR